SLAHLGIVERDRSNYDAALELLQQAYALRSNTVTGDLSARDKRNMLADNLREIGAVYRLKDDFHNAMAYCTRAKETAEEGEVLKSQQTHALYEIGSI